MVKQICFSNFRKRQNQLIRIENLIIEYWNLESLIINSIAKRCKNFLKIII